MRLDLAGAAVRRSGANFDDLTDSRLTGEPHWDGSTLVLPFDVDPSPTEVRLIRRRLVTANAAHEAWVGRVVAADAGVRDSLTLNPAAKTLLRVLAQGALLGIEDLDMEA